MGDPNRTFRLATPQHARVCRNTCHESLRQVRGSAQTRGSSRFEVLLADDGPLNPFESFSVRFGDVRRSVTQQQPVDWDLYAKGDGERFWALRVDAHSESLSPVELQWEQQSFSKPDTATTWETIYSPLIAYGDSSFVPLVDYQGTVVGYFGFKVNLFHLRLFSPKGGEVDPDKHWEETPYCGGRVEKTFVLWEDDEVVYDKYPESDPKNERLSARLSLNPGSSGFGTDYGENVIFDIQGFVQSDFTYTFSSEPAGIDPISIRDIIEFFAVGAAFKLASPLLRGIVVGATKVATRAGRVALLTLRRTGKKAGKVLRRIFQPSAESRGILTEHLMKLKMIAKRDGRIIVIRGAKPKSLQYIKNRDYISKPYEVKLKTDPESGLVKRPEVWTEEQLKNWKELEANGYRFDENGILLNRQGKAIYSDYDIMGIYERTERGGKWRLVNLDRGKIGKLNHEVAGHDGALFRHEGQDSFVRHAEGKSVPGNLSKESDWHLVVDGEADAHFYLQGQSEVFEYYAQKGIDAPQLRIPSASPR